MNKEKTDPKIKSNAPRILVVGSMNIDLVLQAERLPAPGESYFGETYEYIPGGKGANQAAAAAKLGGEVTFVGRVGADAHGKRLQENLEKLGISTELMSIDPDRPTGLAVIFIEPSGENRIMVYSGANMALSSEEAISALKDRFDAVMLNFEIPDEVVEKVCREAISQGMKVIIDAGPARSFDLEKLKGIAVLSPNETETEALTGIRCDTIEEAKRAAVFLAKETAAGAVVIKMGKRGALLYDSSEEDPIPRLFETHLEVKAIDATAAGDAFTAAMTVRLLESGSLEEAVRYGNVSGTLAVSKFGAQPSLPTREEAESFLRGLR